MEGSGYRGVDVLRRHRLPDPVANASDQAPGVEAPESAGQMSRFRAILGFLTEITNKE
jgi:hypothetical protein